jgi:hypothetical protein
MEDATQLYRTLLRNRAYLRSLCEGAAFLAASERPIQSRIESSKRIGVPVLSPVNNGERTQRDPPQLDGMT